MDFSDAFDSIRYDDFKVRREVWSDGVFIACSPGFTLTADRVFSANVQEAIGDGVGTFNPYVMMRNSRGEFEPWTPTQEDLFAEDWDTV